MEIFFTDQSGLEMADRKLGRRWNNEYYPTSHYNISANYYPITNAIAIRDYGDNLNDQLTIIVDRTVGGSVIQKSRIELMHARRLLTDDINTREVVLNETSESPKTTYRLQLFDRRYEEPLQRRQ